MQRFGFALTKECSDADAKKKKVSSNYAGIIKNDAQFAGLQCVVFICSLCQGTQQKYYGL